MLFGVILISQYSCEKYTITTPIEWIYDTIEYEVLLTIKDDRIINMEEMQAGINQKIISIVYTDGMAVKLSFSKGVLDKKSIYYLNELHAADSSIDSVYSSSKYYKAYYTYDDNGYLIKESITPGVFSGFPEPTDSCIYEYRIDNGNRYGIWFHPSSVLTFTSVDTYEYSDLPMKYDIIEYSNSCKGTLNRNLPESFGNLSHAKEGHGQRYQAVEEYEYIMMDQTVIKMYSKTEEYGSINRLHLCEYRYKYRFE